MNMEALNDLNPLTIKIGLLIISLFIIWLFYKLMKISPPLAFFVISTVVLIYTLYHYFFRDIINETDLFEPNVSLTLYQENHATMNT